MDGKENKMNLDDRCTKKSFQHFLAIWAGEFISSIGSGLTAFALGVYVYQVTGTATSVALVTLCAFLPCVLLSPIAGVFADRFDRRLMMIIGNLCSALSLVFILLCIFTGGAELWPIYIGVAASSVFASLIEPAYKATVTDMLTKDQFAKASGLVQLAGSAKYLVSPVIAGFLLMLADIQVVLAMDIVTFLIAAILISIVKKRIKIGRKQLKSECFQVEIKEGWRAVTSVKGVFCLTMVLAMVTFYIGFLQTLFAPMMLSFTDAKTLGTILSICAAGMLFTSLFIGVFYDFFTDMFHQEVSYARMLSVGICLGGFFFSLMGFTTEIYWITGAGFLFFSSLPLINTSADVLIRINIPSEAQGRAWGVIGVLSQLGYVAAYAVSGVLADHIFNPLLVENGLLAATVGKWIGTGPSRGIGLLFILSGFFMMMLAAIMKKAKAIEMLEE